MKNSSRHGRRSSPKNRTGFARSSHPKTRKATGQHTRPPKTLSQLAGAIRQAHGNALAGFRQGLPHAKMAGDHLLKAKALLRHGKWLPWLEKNCQFSERTAQFYMRISRRWGTLRAN